MKKGYKTRAWCCQDKSRKKAKPSTKTNVAHHDTPGMERFECWSRLIITSRECRTPSLHLVTICLWHCLRHKPYYDVSMPSILGTKNLGPISHGDGSADSLSMDRDE
jgi:hypothetical protein